MTETTRIRWEPTGHGGWTGHAGTLKPWLFQVFRPEREGEDWALMSQFPGTLGKYHLRRDPDELKAEAERWLEEFVSSLGAAFEPATDQETAVKATGGDKP